MTAPWLTVIGVAAEGLTSLTPAARTLAESAEVLVGSTRHLEMIQGGRAERIVIRPPMAGVIAAIARHKGRRVTVLASGDPLHYGIAVTLLAHFAADEITVLPHHSSFTLACARLNWPRQHVTTLSMHGRPPDILHRYIHPGARLLILADDRDAPAKIAVLLTLQGYGPSRLVALENLGGEEAIIEGNAEDWQHPRGRDLVIVAAECRAGPHAIAYSTAPGLPDEAFEHDSHIIRRELRAMTLSVLAPLPGQRLWDVGAGTGAIAIEWLRIAPTMQAVAIERDASRADRIARNALALGVPELLVRRGAAPAVLVGLPRPDAVFIGGGLTADGVIEQCWDALAPGGRLVANAVTIAGETILANHQRNYGGTLTRIALSRATAFGASGTLRDGAPEGWRPLPPVTQFCAVKA